MNRIIPSPPQGQCVHSSVLVTVRALGHTFAGQRDLVRLLETGELEEALKSAASQVPFSSYRNVVREAAAKYPEPPVTRTAEGTPLPSVEALALLEGNPNVGREVFRRACAGCHVAAGDGVEFGPGLSTIGSKLPKEALYTAILHPSAGISMGYEGFVVQLRDGTEGLGIIESETADELVLRVPGGISRRYDKSAVVSTTQLDRSMMPHGLEGALTQGELVDLVEYLATLR